MAKNQKDNSTYGRKAAFLKNANRRPKIDEDESGGRIFGFHYPIGKKPWVKGSK